MTKNRYLTKKLNEDDLQWKMNSKYQKKYISATTYWIIFKSQTLAKVNKPYFADP
jgi:hypothetical protein